MDAQYTPPTATVAERLKTAMEIRHMSAAETSRAADISRAAMSHYLRGQYAPKQDKIYLLSKALRVSPVWLMGFDVPMEGGQQSHHPAVSRSGAAPAPIPAPSRHSPDATLALPLAGVGQKVAALRAALSEQLVLIDEVEASLHPAMQKEVEAWANKYSRLSKNNQKIINTTIETMLKTQALPPNSSDADVFSDIKKEPPNGAALFNGMGLKKKNAEKENNSKDNSAND